MRLAKITLVFFLACRTDPSATAPSSSSSPSQTPSETPSLSLSPPPNPTSSQTPSPSPLATRPYRLDLPDSATGPLPLVILLHGYGSNGPGHDQYFGLSTITKRRGVMLAIPNGTRDHTGKLFWNATDACCDFDDDKKSVDDVAYLDAIIDDVAKRASLDVARVYIVGHSNGGFMAHRYACDRDARVAAIVSLAGVPWSQTEKCAGKNVSVLQVHGDADTIIAFEGGHSFGNGAPYPSAEAAVAGWAKRDSCGAARHAEGAIDLDLGIAGAETTRESYDCPDGLAVSLWRMHGGGHVPRFDSRFANAALDFLLKHHK